MTNYSMNFPGDVLLDGARAWNASNTTESASGVPDDAQDVPDYQKLYYENREWAERQAQKMMDYQTNANRIAMDFSADQVEKARAWESQMANTAYQRAAADLKAAGLNPVLALMKGGAAVPSVSAASGVTSSGTQASMKDTGYTAAQLDYAYIKMIVSAATDIIGDLTSLAKVKVK